MFDPHNHIGGMVPYRVLAALTPGSAETRDQLLDHYAGQIEKIIGYVPSPVEFESYLAHHELPDHDGGAIKVRPWEDERPEAVWATKYAYRDGSFEPSKRTVVVCEELARIEFALIARFFVLVRDMLVRAQEKNWLGKKGRLEAPSASRILPKVIEAMRKIEVPLDEWLAAPDAAPLRDMAPPMKRLLQNTFTSTPVTDYDTAYVARGFLQKKELFDGGPAFGWSEVVAAGLNEFDRQGIDYAEVSAAWDDVLEVVKLDTSQWDVRIGWLTAIPNGLVIGSDEVAFEKEIEHLKETLKSPKVMGFSMLSPEVSYAASPQVTNLNRHVPRLIRELAKYAAPDRHLVAHFHAGEGTARWRIDEDTLATALVSKRRVVKPQLDDAGMKEQAKASHDNVDAVLTAVQWCAAEELKHVRVRLGHVTHADEAQAVRMKDLGIWADVNLTSNAATSVWYVEDAVTPIDVKRLEPGRYAQHAVTHLARKGTRFVLGTDGSGAEHSAMRVELDFLRRLARSKGLGEDEWAKLALRNGLEHTDWIWSGRATERVAERASIDRGRRDEPEKETDKGKQPVTHNL